jgi:type IV pilus biogenesis protein CpaD/CtpE
MTVGRLTKNNRAGFAVCSHVRLNMRSIFLTIIATLLVGCATTPDPVDQLVNDFSSSHGLWEKGLFPIIKLPATAPIGEVVSEVLERQVASYKILRVRQVHIRGSLPDLYTAVIVQTNVGEKIILLKYAGESVGWWSRIYDAKKSASSEGSSVKH